MSSQRLLLPPPSTARRTRLWLSLFWPSSSSRINSRCFLFNKLLLCYTRAPQNLTLRAPSQFRHDEANLPIPSTGLRCVRMDYDKPSRIDETMERRYEQGEWGVGAKWVNRLRKGKPLAWEMEKGKGKDKMDEKEEEEIDMARAIEEVMKHEKEGKEGEFDFRQRARRRSRPPFTTASTSTADRDAIEMHQPSPARSRVPQDIDFSALEPIPSLSASSRSNHPSPYVRVFHSILSVLNGFASPPTVALLSALVIALIPSLKSLFVYTDDSSFHPTAPDGDPPLAIVYNTATFVGAASVPLGLTVLGASIAKMEIPRPISRLPLASIGAMVLVKVVLLPIIGFFFVEALVHRGMVSADNAVLRFSTFCSSSASSAMA